MSNIRVDLGYTIRDGAEIKFRSPVDCSQITGLIVYYPGADGNTTSKVFALADAHGNNVGNIDHLFAENVMVKVILDVTKGMAFVQNADTNAYLEAQLASKRPNTWLPTIAEIGAAPAGYGLGEDGRVIYDMNAINFNGFFICQGNMLNAPTYNNGSGTYDYGWGYSVSRWGTYVEVNYFPCLSDRFRLVRNKIDGVWGEWEYVNPPMVAGVEYRTTERYDGKPVYTKVVSYYIDSSGAGSVSGVTDLAIPHGISNFGAIVRCDATCSIFPLPIRDGENRCVTVYSVDSSNITLRFINDRWSSAPFKFALYYTKA